MGFRLVPKSVTLNDLERRSGSNFAFLPNLVVYGGALRKNCMVDKVITIIWTIYDYYV